MTSSAGLFFSVDLELFACMLIHALKLFSRQTVSWMYHLVLSPFTLSLQVLVAPVEGEGVGLGSSFHQKEQELK